MPMNKFQTLVSIISSTLMMHSFMSPSLKYESIRQHIHGRNLQHIYDSPNTTKTREQQKQGICGCREQKLAKVQVLDFRTTYTEKLYKRIIPAINCYKVQVTSTQMFILCEAFKEKRHQKSCPKTMMIHPKLIPQKRQGVST